MKTSNKVSVVVLTAILALGLTGQITAFAATTPSLGMAATYAILASTYTNTSAGTTVNGDVGFTTGPAVAPAGVHTNYGSGAPYATAGTDQGSALSSLNSEPCDFSFGAATDLSLLTQPLTPGVYCVTGAQSVGTAGITLNGAGTYIFRSTGAFNTVANSAVTLAGGASVCDVFWTPSAATTLAANTTLAGTIIGNAGVTVGANTTWSGRSLTFGGTVTSDTDTITAPTCAVIPIPPANATLRIIKQVVNDNDGTGIASLFNLHVKLSGTDVSGSPAVGTVTPGTSYSLPAGTYIVSEDANASYAKSFSGDCDASGNITLASGDNKTCTVTNNDIAAVVIPASSATLHIIKQVVNDDGGIETASLFNLHVKLSGTDVTGSPAVGTVTPGTSYTLSAGTYVVSEDANASYTKTFSGDCNSSGSVTLIAGDNKTCTVTNDDIATATTVDDEEDVVVSDTSAAPETIVDEDATVVTAAPGFPSTGIAPYEKSAPWNIIIPAGIFVVLFSFYLIRRKRTI